MPRPAVATVVVAYNSADELAATLGALTSQTEPGDEVVVVDNGSADASADAARRAAPDAHVLELGGNEGFAAACHAGARATTAPLLFLLNPDATLEPGCLDTLRATAEERQGWGAWQPLVLLPGGDRVNSEGGITHWLGFGWAGGCDMPAADVVPGPHEVSFASGAALVIRREAWTAVGGFDPEYFMYGEDLDLSLRLRLAGWGVGMVPGARVQHGYEFSKGAYKWFYLERNRAWTVLGTYPTRLLAVLAPALLAFELALLAVAARDGWLQAKLRAQAAVLRSLPWALRRRRRVQSLRRVPAGAFAAGLSASLDSPYLGAAARIEPVARLQARYWALACALVVRRS